MFRIYKYLNSNKNKFGCFMNRRAYNLRRDIFLCG